MGENENKIDYGWTAQEMKNVTGDNSSEAAGPMNRSASNSYGQYLRKNTKNYDNFKYFLEGIDATDQNLDQMTPFIPGAARLFFHKTPYFMHAKFQDLTDNFRSYLETGVKSVTGIGDLTGTEATIEGGWANQKLDNISMVTDDTNQIEVTLYEQTGSPVREFIETWLTGMRDPRSGVAHYHGAVMSPDGGRSDGSSGDGIVYSEKNHTGEFIYVVLDPTAQFIEYACLLAHVWPKNMPKQHLNYTSGDRTPPELTLQFSCIKYEGKYINDIAAYYISKSNLIYNYLDFNPYAGDIDAHATLSKRRQNQGNFEEYIKKTTDHAGTETWG